MTDVEHLHKSLIDFYTRFRRNVWGRWQRDLPFDKLLFDRWDWAKRLGFGDGIHISSIHHCC